MEHSIIVLAAGASSRMKNTPAAHIHPALAEQAKTMPKAMLGVGKSGRPFLDYLLHNILMAGYTHVVLVTPPADSLIRRHCEGHPSSLKFSFVPQLVPEGRLSPLGTADAVLQALRATPSLINSKVTVCNSDNLYSTNALRLLLTDNHANALIAYDRRGLHFDGDRVARFAVVRADKDGFLTQIIEKPDADDLVLIQSQDQTSAVSMNVWRFTCADILPCLNAVPEHPVRHEKELPEAVRLLTASNPRSVFAISLSEHVIDLTSQADIQSVQDFLQKHFPDNLFER